MDARKWEELPLVMTVSDVSLLLQVTVSTVRAMCARGALPAVKIGGEGRAGEWRIHREDVRRLLKVPA